MKAFTCEEVWRAIDALKAQGVWRQWAEHERRTESWERWAEPEPGDSGLPDLDTPILRTMRDLGLAKTLTDATYLKFILRSLLRHELGLWIGEDLARKFAGYLTRP